MRSCCWIFSWGLLGPSLHTKLRVTAVNSPWAGLTCLRPSLPVEASPPAPAGPRLPRQARLLHPGHGHLFSVPLSVHFSPPSPSPCFLPFPCRSANLLMHPHKLTSCFIYQSQFPSRRGRKSILKKIDTFAPVSLGGGSFPLALKIPFPSLGGGNVP